MQSFVPNVCRLHKHAKLITGFVQHCRFSRGYCGNENFSTSVGDKRWICNSQHTLRSTKNDFNGTISPLSKRLSTSSTLTKQETIKINYIGRDGTKMTVNGVVGDSLLDVAIDNDLDIEGYGACEGTLACSTCHLIFEEPQFNSLPEASDEEQDMLDFACGLSDTSRLGCQIILSKDMDGMTVTVPDGVADARGV